MTEPYYSFNSYLRGQFSGRVRRISLDAGFSCPNLDGTLSQTGCIFCNNKAFGVNAGNKATIETQIKDSIRFYGEKQGVDKFVAYFQSFTNTYAPVAELKKKFDTIRKFPQIKGLFISTRPDCVDEEKIEFISRYAKDYLVWIEYGLQATNNRILESINRKHTYEDFLRALELTRKYSINTAAHMIIGLPGAAYEDIIKDARNLAGRDIQGIKFHILSVFRGTKLEELYNAGKINLLSEKDYVKIICDYLEIISPGTVILRLLSNADPEYLIAPLWVNDKARVLDAIKAEFAKRCTRQGSKNRKMKDER